MAVFLPLYERIHLCYNENEITTLMYDQLDETVQKHNNEMLQLYVLIYVWSLFCITFIYIMYIIIT